MSFGFSIGDIIKVVSILLTTYKDCRSAPEDLAHASRDAESLELVLKALSEEFNDPDSPLRHDETAQQTLDVTIDHCKSVLMQLHKILLKFKGSPEPRMNLHNRFRMPKKELLEIRSKLSSHKSTLAAALSVTGLRALRKLSGTVDQKLGEMLSIMTTFEEKNRADQPKIGSQYSDYSHDEASVWKAFRRELIRDGITSIQIKEYRQELKSHLKMLTDKNLVEVEIPIVGSSPREDVPEDLNNYTSADDGTIHGDSNSSGTESARDLNFKPEYIQSTNEEISTALPMRLEKEISSPGHNSRVKGLTGASMHGFVPDTRRSRIAQLETKPQDLKQDRPATPEYLAGYMDDEDNAPSPTRDKTVSYPGIALSWANYAYNAVWKFWKWIFKKSYEHGDLLRAAYHGNKSEVSRLLSKGCSTEERDFETGQTPLHYATWTGHEAVFKMLLDRGAKMEAKDEDGDTVVHTAAATNQEWAMKLLLLKKRRCIDLRRFWLGDASPLNLEIENEAGETPLLVAVSNGNLQIANLLLSRGADVEAQCEGWTALLLAVSEENPEMIRLLLDKGAEIEARVGGKTPLLFAIENGNLSSAALLLKRGASVAAHCGGETALLLAVKQGITDFVALILEKMTELNGRSDINARYLGMTALLLAIRNGHKGIVSMLLQNGADPDDPIREHSDPLWRFTPLLQAIAIARTDIVAILLEWKASINRSSGPRNTGRWTPLTYAAAGGDHETTQLLLENKADTEATSALQGETALLLAAREGHLKTIKLLLSKNANIEAISDRGLTPLLIAVRSGHYTTVAYLLEKRARIDVRDAEKLTSIHLAMKHGREELVLLLLEKGADISSITVIGRTPLHFAALEQNQRIIKLLIDNEADIEARTLGEGFTALHEAVLRSAGQVVALLIENRANIESRVSQTGETPLNLAVRHELIGMLDLLLAKGANIEARVGIKQAEDENVYTETPLYTAVRLKRSVVLEMLLEKGADVDSRSGTHASTALHEAVWGAQSRFIAKLLEKGAKIDMKDSDGRTPLFLAVYQGNFSAAKLLLEKGADPDAVTNSSNTVLSRAIELRNVEMIQELLRHNVHPSDEEKQAIRSIMREAKGSLSHSRGTSNGSMLQIQSRDAPSSPPAKNLEIMNATTTGQES